jgi:hypothetical protein
VGGLEDDHILVCTSDAVRKATDMRRDPRVAMSVTDMANPYRMAAIQGRVVEVRPDEGCRYMDPISFKYERAIPQPRPRSRVFRDRGGEGGWADARLRPQSELAHLRSGPCTS